MQISCANYVAKNTKIVLPNGAEAPLDADVLHVDVEQASGLNTQASGLDIHAEQVSDRKEMHKKQSAKLAITRESFKRARCYRPLRFAGTRVEYSEKEIRFLRDSFSRHGSKWMTILRKGRSVFHPCRSSQCLKDKWRSLQKAKKRSEKRAQERSQCTATATENS